jgi:ribose 5-phosphate isomerase A
VSAEAQKEQAAMSAVAHVESKMVLGLGTGSTAKYATLEIGRRLAAGELRDLRAAVTSEATGALARSLGIPVIDLPRGGVDLAIDGMDEVTGTLDAIKGLGGALLREKIVEARAARFILIGDASKRVRYLGERAPVPVEVLPFGLEAASRDLEALGCRPVLRLSGGRPVTTDNGHHLLDCHFSHPFDPQEVALAISQIPGVLGHGLFLGLAHLAYLASDDGVDVLERA